jgi:hypothetical protein
LNVQCGSGSFSHRKIHFRSELSALEIQWQWPFESISNMPILALAAQL